MCDSVVCDVCERSANTSGKMTSIRVQSLSEELQNTPYTHIQLSYRRLCTDVELDSYKYKSKITLFKMF